MARGVEPLGVAALLGPVDGAKDEPEPEVAASFAVFFTAATSSATIFTVTTSSAAFFTTAASSATFFTAAVSSATFFTAAVSSMAFFTVAASIASFSVAALAATATSPAAELALDPAGTVAHSTADESGRGAVAASRGLRPLIHRCQPPSSTFAVGHHHQMIPHCRCG
jgi:hypothetical protein